MVVGSIRRASAVNRPLTDRGILVARCIKNRDYAGGSADVAVKELGVNRTADRSPLLGSPRRTSCAAL